MNRLLHSLLLLFASLLVFNSCRRTELENTPHTNEKEGRFFSVPASASAQAKAIAEAIRKQNAKYRFVTDVIKKAGYPVWDKARIVNNVTGTASGRSSSDSIPEEVVYIPFVLDSGNTTNAVLSVALNGTDTTYRMAYANRYRLFGYDTTSSGWNARKAFSLFAGFDYTVFGHTRFVIKDTLLFRPPNNTMRMVATLASHNGAAVVGRTANWFNCHWWDMCPKIVGNEHQSVRSASDCTGGFRVTLCFPEIGGSGGTGTGGGTSGDPASYGWTGTGSGGADQYTVSGGGSSTGWWSGGGSTPCQGSSQTRSTDALPYCPPGWSPMETIYVNGVAYSPSSYPGIDGGLPWKWWANAAFLQPYGGINFGSWAINYLSQHPTISFSTFQNQFMGISEGQDGTYDAAFWGDPTLTFPPQNLPTWDDFNNAFPKDSDTLYDSPEKMFNSIGGDVATFYGGPQTNTCAIRLSKALNYSGIVIPHIPGQTYKGADNKYYFKAAYQINIWMRKTFGTNPATSTTPLNPQHFSYTQADAGIYGENLPGLLAGKKGIYSIYSSNFQWATGHVDLLNPNSTCGNNCHFADAPIARLDVWVLN